MYSQICTSTYWTSQKDVCFTLPSKKFNQYFKIQFLPHRKHTESSLHKTVVLYYTKHKKTLCEQTFSYVCLFVSHFQARNLISTSRFSFYLTENTLNLHYIKQLLYIIRNTKTHYVSKNSAILNVKSEVRIVNTVLYWDMIPVRKETRLLQ